MTDVPSTAKTLAELTVGVPNAGRRTLLAALPGLAEGRFPENLRVCVLDAERMDSPAQIALLDGLAADPLLDVIFALNKADRITGPRTVITRTLALLRERGFRQPTLYPICARAALLFGLPTEQIAGDALMSELGSLYFRYSPGEQSLSAFAVTRDGSLCLGSREVTPEQLRLAMTNTGVPALAAALEGLRVPEPVCVEAAGDGQQATGDAPEMQNEGSEIRDQGSEDGGTDLSTPLRSAQDDMNEPASDDTVGDGALDVPLDEPASDVTPEFDEEPDPDEVLAELLELVGLKEPEDQATGSGQQATEDAPETQVAECKVQDEGSEIRDQGSEDGGTDLSTPLRSVQDDINEADAAAGDGVPDVPSEETAPDEAVGAVIDRPQDAPAPDDTLGDGALDVPQDEPAPDEAVGTVIDRPQDAPAPEAPAFDAAPLDVPSLAAESDAEAAPAAQLDELLTLAKTADCTELLELARCIPAVKASDELRDRALDVLHDAYQTRQIEELDALTQDADELGLDALHALADRIVSGPYTVQARTPYAARLNRRIDELQSGELDALCAEVETTDARGLARIREALEKTDCAEVLKTEHYRRIEARQEALDLEALDRVTAGAEQMSEKELRALAVTLEANNWNQKYVTGYRHRVNLLREAAVYREVQDALADLNDMERREVLALRERIAEKGLPARYTAGAEVQIEEKLYRLDMLRLMALNNDLDRLDFDGLDELRAIVARGDYNERARKEYLDRLMTREKALILENTSARAELTRQLIAQHKLRMSDFVISTSSRDYEENLDAFWGGTGLEQPRDIPVFLFDNASDYAMSGSRFYYKSGRDLAFVPIENVDHFQVMRQHLSLSLQIVGKDNSYRLTDAKISRSGAERTLAFLNDCVSRWAEPGPPTSRGLSAELRLPRLDASDYTAPVEAEPPTARDAWTQFCAAYEKAGLRHGNLVRPGDEAAAERLRKLRTNFGLPENAPLVWFESASRLGPVKEGAAIGPRAVYLKDGKLPLRSIPIEEVFEIRAASGRRVTVSSLHNETLTLETSEDMVPLLTDYVRTIQLGAWLRGAEAKA